MEAACEGISEGAEGSVVRHEDFHPERLEPPDWLEDPEVCEMKKQEWISRAEAKATSWPSWHEMDDDCFACGEKLSIPFIYWAGAGKQICLHCKCAGELGAALMRDHLETIQDKESADNWYSKHRVKRPPDNEA